MKRIFSICALLNLSLLCAFAKDEKLVISAQDVDLRANTPYILLGEVVLSGVSERVKEDLVLALKLKNSDRFLELSGIKINSEKVISVCEYFYFDEDVSGKLAVFVEGNSGIKISSANLVLIDDNGVNIAALSGTSQIISQSDSASKNASGEDKLSEYENSNSSNQTQGNDISQGDNSSVNLEKLSKTIYVSRDFGSDKFSGRYRAISVAEGPKKTLSAALAEGDADRIVVEQSSQAYEFPKDKISGRTIEIKAMGTVKIKASKQEHE